MRRVLFCNIAYLPHYDTELDRVAPINGGSYVANEGDALESTTSRSVTTDSAEALWKRSITGATREASL